MKVMTKGVKRYRKWLKHLHGEGHRIAYSIATYGSFLKGTKGTPPFSAYIERKEGKLVRFVPGRMAQQVWRLRRDQ